MKTEKDVKLVYSKPTRCLKCSLVNEMTYPVGMDLKAGAWTCAKCGHHYLFAHWKIKKAGRDKAEKVPAA